jgi:hypothetical protein
MAGRSAPCAVTTRPITPSLTVPLHCPSWRAATPSIRSDPSPKNAASASAPSGAGLQRCEPPEASTCSTAASAMPARNRCLKTRHTGGATATAPAASPPTAPAELSRPSLLRPLHQPSQPTRATCDYRCRPLGPESRSGVARTSVALARLCLLAVAFASSREKTGPNFAISGAVRVGVGGGNLPGRRTPLGVTPAMTTARIAPRRSPVRVRLAPSPKSLHKRVFRFLPRHLKLQKSIRGQALVK